MKILYYANIEAFAESGVLNKIVQQIRSWNDCGHDVKLLLRTKIGENKGTIPDSLVETNHIVVYSKFIKYFIQKGFTNLQTINKIFSFHLAKSEIDKFTPDIIYTRFALWYPFFTTIFSTYPLFVEMNSLDREEIKLRGKFDELYHSITRRILIDRANAFCCVTHEIQDSIIDRNKPSIVIGNGYSLDIRPINSLVDNTLRPNLIFVGSGDCPWHGVDKIILMASELYNFDFTIVGPLKEFQSSSSSNISFLGPKFGRDLESIYMKADIAIGTLALHRNGMYEACPLKVREYVFYGLPVIIGYKDTDLEGKEYILDIGCCNNNVSENIGKIRDFVLKWKGKKVSDDLGFLSYNTKEKNRLNFIKSLCDE